MSQESITSEECHILLDATRDEFAVDAEMLDKFEVEIVPVYELTTEQSDACLNILDHNLGPTYTKVNGRNWKADKRDEMEESGLVYLLLWQGPKLVGFLSFRLISQFQVVLYLYEIQFTEALRGHGLGTFMIGKLTKIVENINRSIKLAQLWQNQYPKEFSEVNDALLTGIGLTVFSSNEGAMRLYKGLGFQIHADSPRDCVLRNGKTIKPPYYMMEKVILH